MLLIRCFTLRFRHFDKPPCHAFDAAAFAAIADAIITPPPLLFFSFDARR